MIYFLILPVFVLWLIAAVAAVLIARRHAPLQPYYPYVLRICIWASVGIVLANVALAALLLLAGPHLAPHPAGVVDTGLAVTWTALLILGPLPATAAGWLVGALMGAVLAYRTSVKLAPVPHG